MPSDAAMSTLDRARRDPSVFADVLIGEPLWSHQVEVVRDSSFSTIAAAVDIATADGQVYRLSTQAARGSDVNPMSDGDLEAKLRHAAAGWNGRHDIQPLIDAIWGLDQSADVAGLCALTVPRQ